MRLITLVFMTASTFACGDSEKKADTTAEVSVEVETTAEVTEGDATEEAEAAVEVVPEVEAVDEVVDTEVNDALDAWDRAPSQLSVVVTKWGDGEARTIIGGAIWDGPEPQSYALEEDTGVCRFFLGENYFCDPPCEAGLCTAPAPNQQCTPYPRMLSGGILSVVGQGNEIYLPHSIDGYAAESEGQLWEVGTSLIIGVEGDDVPAFEAQLRMVEPIVGTDLALLDLKQPLVIEWAAPTSSGDPTRVNIKLQSDRGQHGRAYASVLECDVPDTGRFEIPAALQALYTADEVWGCGKCPQSTITRYVRTRVEAGGHPIDVIVSTQESFLLTPWSTPVP